MERYQFRLGKVDYYVQYVDGKVHFTTASCTKMSMRTLPTICSAYMEFFNGFHRSHKVAAPYQNRSRVTISFPVSESRFNRWIQTKAT